MKTQNIFLYLPLLLVLMLGTMGCGSDDEVDMTIEQVRNIDESGESWGQVFDSSYNK